MIFFFLHSAQASFSWPRVDLARLLRRACSRSFSITSFEFVKVCGIRFSIWESFIGFYICCYFILSRNFVGALRITTTNYRVSFIDLYLVFPRNFRIIFLPHTNTVILLEPYCGSITEPGLPVVIQKLPRFPASHIAFTRCSFNVLGMMLSVCQF